MSLSEPHQSRTMRFVPHRILQQNRFSASYRVLSRPMDCPTQRPLWRLQRPLWRLQRPLRCFRRKQRSHFGAALSRPTDCQNCQATKRHCPTQLFACPLIEVSRRQTMGPFVRLTRLCRRAPSTVSPLPRILRARPPIGNARSLAAASPRRRERS